MAFARHPAAASVIQPAGVWNPKRWFNAFRQQTVLLLRDNLTTKNRATAEALLLGNRGHLTPDVERDFIASGTMHLLAISGLHVGILFVFLVRLQNLLLVSRTRSLLLAGLVCVFYALLTDLRPSVMRATCFILLYILGQTLYRDIRMGSLIGATAMLLIVLNPSIAFDVGAWLSFLAVGALGWVSEHDPPPEDRAAPPDAVTWQDQFREARGQFWEWVRLNYRRMLAITVLTAPLVATQFHVVSLLGMVINILLIPLTTVTLICGYIAIFSRAARAASGFDRGDSVRLDAVGTATWCVAGGGCSSRFCDDSRSSDMVCSGLLRFAGVVRDGSACRRAPVFQNQSADLCDHRVSHDLSGAGA